MRLGLNIRVKIQFMKRAQKMEGTVLMERYVQLIKSRIKQLQ